MKTSIIALAIALTSGAVFASNEHEIPVAGVAGASSAVQAAGFAGTANIGSGFAVQKTSAGAWDRSGASVNVDREGVNTGAYTKGGAYSKTFGISHHAIGTAGSLAGFEGEAGSAGLISVQLPRYNDR